MIVQPEFYALVWSTHPNRDVPAWMQEYYSKYVESLAEIEVNDMRC